MSLEKDSTTFFPWDSLETVFNITIPWHLWQTDRWIYFVDLIPYKVQHFLHIVTLIQIQIYHQVFQAMDGKQSKKLIDAIDLATNCNCSCTT